MSLSWSNTLRKAFHVQSDCSGAKLFTTFPTAPDPSGTVIVCPYTSSPKADLQPQHVTGLLVRDLLLSLDKCPDSPHLLWFPSDADPASHWIRCFPDLSHFRF